MKLKITLLSFGIICSCFLQQALAQTLTISGTVKNNTTGEALARATVSVEGTSSTQLRML